jgi:hypothetical protein
LELIRGKNGVVFETVLDDERVTVTADVSPRLLERTVAHLARVDIDAVRITHSCPRCGSNEHGAPSTALPFFVSASRVAETRAAAVSAVAPVGIDIESIAKFDRAAVDDVFLHPDEATIADGMISPQRSRFLTRLWTAKEAILKLAGFGFAIDPRELHLEPGVGGFVLVVWPSVLGLAAAPELHGFDVDADIVGTVAIGRG